MSSLRHLSCGAGLLRARRQRWPRIDSRPGAGPRVRDAAVRSGLSGHSRARLASCDADGVRLADRCRTHAAPRLAEDSARHRHQRQRTRHAGSGDRRQADHDEEHGRPTGDAERRAGGPAGGEGLHRPRARHRRQRGNRPLPRAGVEAECSHRWTGRIPGVSHNVG